MKQSRTRLRSVTYPNPDPSSASHRFGRQNDENGDFFAWAHHSSGNAPSLLPTLTEAMVDVNDKYPYGIHPTQHWKRNTIFGARQPNIPGFYSNYIQYVADSQTAWDYPIQYAIRGLPMYYSLFPLTLPKIRSGFSDSSIPTEIIIDKDPFDRKFSIWFLITDLTQLKGLILGPALSKRRLKGLEQRAKRYHASKATARELANDHLLVQFGLIPTVKDAVEFISILKDWMEFYDETTKAFRTIRRFRASEIELPYFKNDYMRQGQLTVPMATLPLRVNVTTDVSICHRTAIYKFISPEFQGWLSRLKQFLDAFGVLDPAAIWDAIPFSFVVDWLIPVGDWLHRNRPRLFPADVKVLDYCESIKVLQTGIWELEYKNRLPATGSPITGPSYWQAVAVDTNTLYDRVRFKPRVKRIKPIPSMNASFLTPRRFFISAALVAQRVPRD